MLNVAANFGIRGLYMKILKILVGFTDISIKKPSHSS